MRKDKATNLGFRVEGEIKLYKGLEKKMGIIRAIYSAGAMLCGCSGFRGG